MVPHGHYAPEDVDGEEGHREQHQPQGLGRVGEVQVHGSLHTQPPGQTGEGRNEEETQDISKKSPPLLLHGRRTPPLRERLGLSLQAVVVLTQLTVAAVGGSEPLLQAALMHQSQGPGALTGGQQRPAAWALMTDPTERLLTLRISGISLLRFIRRLGLVKVRVLWSFAVEELDFFESLCFCNLSL